ncbi:MAG TPA: nucleotidyltransferase family protein [Thermomicrobiales bacterium]|jgi:hypothetical protein
MVADPLPPHRRLLLACASPAPDPLAIAAIVPAVTDWEAVAREAQGHGLLPLVYEGVRGVAGVPVGALRLLRARFEENGREILRLTGELRRLLDAFAIAAIPVLPYKGPTLALIAYGSLARRQFRDLDMLVRPQDVERAIATLIANGYHPTREFSPAQWLLYRRAQCELAFLGENGVVVELHWALFPRYYAFSPDLAALWSRLRPVSVGGRAVPTLAPEDLFLFLCAHGAKHDWRRLEWIANLAALIARTPTLDWAAIEGEARRLGGLRFLHLGALLTGEWLAAPVPAWLLAQAGADRGARALAAQVRHTFGAPETAETPDDEQQWHPLHLRVRERRRDRLRYAWFWVVAPTVLDFAVVRLPLPLWPLYYLIRPLRLLARLGNLNGESVQR